MAKCSVYFCPASGNMYSIKTKSHILYLHTSILLLPENKVWENDKVSKQIRSDSLGQAG